MKPPRDQVECLVIALDGSEQGDKSVAALGKWFPKTRLFQAVDAREFSDEDVKTLVTPDCFNAITSGKSVVKHIPTSKGAVGCALSHRAVWEHCVDTGMPVLVAEEDVDFLVGESAERVLSLFRNIPDDAVFASLVHHPYPSWFHEADMKGKTVDENWVKLGSDFSGTQLYYLTPYAATALLKNHEPINMHVDVYIAHVGLMDDAKWLASSPSTNPYSMVQAASDSLNESTVGHHVNFAKLLPENQNVYIGFGVFVLLLLLALAVLSYIVINQRRSKERPGSTSPGRRRR